jgi:hypothetical protein
MVLPKRVMFLKVAVVQLMAVDASTDGTSHSIAANKAAALLSIVGMAAGMVAGIALRNCQRPAVT